MYWAIAVLVLIFGAALLPRLRGARPVRERPARASGPIFPTVPPLRPGEVYDTTVKLATLPNVPLADLWRQRLKEHGIEAFLKTGSPFMYGAYGGPQLSPGQPAELWVGQHDAKRAVQLMRELG
jgi:hypothetical protein